jgi:hypothetical protein
MQIGATMLHSLHRKALAVGAGLAITAGAASSLTVPPASAHASAAPRGAAGHVATPIAHASNAYSCVMYGRAGVSAVIATLSRDPYEGAQSLVSIASNASGCGNWVAGVICSASRQWWGGPFRSIVRVVTRGRYSTC